MKRRDFLIRAAQASALVPLASSGLIARPLAHSYFARPDLVGDRILVLINLNGGNDGLNTVVPFDNAIYYNSRPDIAIAKNQTVRLTDTLGLNPAMTELGAYYEQGDFAIVNNVGYPDQNRSHFRSTDIWNTASDADEIRVTGWLGRYLETIHPEYPTVLPDAPFALQISSSTSLALLGEKGTTGIALDNPERFYRLANGLDVETTPVPATKAGPELEYVRSIIRQSDTFSRKVNDAMVDGENHATYATDSLSSQLKVVGRLINGGLATTVYIVTLPGFDTHSRQIDSHTQLLSYLSSAVSDFLSDMNVAGNGDRVVVMTYSEFGRRLNQNGSLGTDHGAAAPQFVFGRPVNGGQVLGGDPDLVVLDDRGDVNFSIDFRSLYSTILQNWLGISTNDTASVLGGTFSTLPLFSTTDVRQEDRARYAGYRLEQSRPNPATTTTEIGFTLAHGARTRVVIRDVRGRSVLAVLDRQLAPGKHSVLVDVSSLPPGAYVCTLEANGYRLSNRMVVVR